MKKIRIFTVVFAALIITSAVMFNACSKQETPEQSIDPGEVHMTSADLKFQKQLVKFRDKVNYIRENPGYKSNEVMSVDSAIWYAEALFNAEYAYGDERYGQTICDTATLAVGLDQNGNVSLDDLTLIYNELYEIVRDFYIACNFSDKGFLLLDLEVASVSGDEALITLRSVTGEKTPESFNWDYFGEDDDWKFNGGLGRCDDLSGWGFDAAIKIQEAIMVTKPYIITPGGYTWVYSDYETIQIYGDEYTNSEDEFLIFYIVHTNGNPNFSDEERCLRTEVANGFDEMNFHYNGEMEVIYEILEPQLDKWFMECTIEGREDSDWSGYPRIRHHNALTFATAHLFPIGIGPGIIKKEIN